jgi:FkbM family methyltransferase
MNIKFVSLLTALGLVVVCGIPGGHVRTGGHLHTTPHPSHSSPAADVITASDDASDLIDLPLTASSFNRECPQLKFEPFINRFLDSADVSVKKIPIDLKFGVPYFVGAEFNSPGAVKHWARSDNENMKMYLGWWKKHGREGAIALDLGANIGLYTSFFAAMGLTTQVYSFEIQKQMFKELQHCMLFNGFRNDRVHLNFIGMSNNNMYMKNLGFSGNGYLAPSSEEEATILAMTLDCWAKSTNFKHKTIDLLKIDVEGFEIAALLGAQETLFDPSVKIGTLLIEIGPDRWARSKIPLGTGVSVLRKVSKKFLKASVILRKDKGCPPTLKDGLNLQQWSSDGVVLYAIQAEDWLPLMKKMLLGGCNCNFWFFNDAMR